MRNTNKWIVWRMLIMLQSFKITLIISLIIIKKELVLPWQSPEHMIKNLKISSVDEKTRTGAIYFTGWGIRTWQRWSNFILQTPNYMTVGLSDHVSVDLSETDPAWITFSIRRGPAWWTRKTLDIVYLGFSKTFDTVYYTILLEKVIRNENVLLALFYKI